MKKLKFVLSMSLAVTLVWVFWYLAYSTVAFYGIRMLTESSDPVLTRPILASGVWRLDNSPEEANASSSMPRILHQAFRSEMIYENYLQMITGCLALNPDWDYYLWRDSDALALIAEHYPTFLPRYRSYRDNLERADSIRYLVLHHFGGIYLDMDVECRRPFYPALSQLPAFIDQERLEQSNILWSMPFCAMNSAMGSIPGHQFFQFMINAMQSYGARTGNAIDSTGPRLLTQKYIEYARLPGVMMPVAILEPRVFSPLMDQEKMWKRYCNNYVHVRFFSTASRGCRTLAAKQWSLDDSDNATLGVHRFLHLGYGFKAASRRASVNLTRVLPLRVKYYRRGVSALGHSTG